MAGIAQTGSVRDGARRRPANGAQQHQTAAAVLAALSLVIGIVCNGFDNALGNGLGYLINAALLVYLLVIVPTPGAFWIWTAPVLAIVLTAALWLALPLTDVGRQVGAVTLVPDIALSQFLGLASAVIALLSGCLMGFRHARKAVVDWILVFAAVAILMGLLLWQGEWPMFADLWGDGQEGRFAGTLGNANVAGTVYAAIATLALARCLEEQKGRRVRPKGGMAVAAPVFRWLLVLLSSGACAATASRSAVALGLFALMVLGGITLIRRRQYRILLIAAAGCGVAGIVLLVGGYAEPMLERSHGLSASSSERWLMWTHCLNLVRDAPVFGYGTGSFPTLNLRALDDPRIAAALWSSNSPHNIALRLMLEGGVPYLALIGLAAAWTGGSILLAYRRGGWDMLSLGLAMAILVITGCAMIDIALDVPAIITLMLFLTGLLWGRAGARTLPLPG